MVTNKLKSMALKSLWRSKNLKSIKNLSLRNFKISIVNDSILLKILTISLNNLNLVKINLMDVKTIFLNSLSLKKLNNILRFTIDARVNPNNGKYIISEIKNVFKSSTAPKVPTGSA